LAKPQKWSRLFTLSGAALLAISLVLGVMPSPAESAVSQVFTARAEGEALQLRLAGNDVIVPGPRVADTTQVPQESGPTSGDIIALPLLGDLLAAGVAAQDAAVDDAGHSKACSGLIGPGGQIEIAAVEVPTCTIDTPTGPAGLIVNLGLLGLFRIRADAIYGECTADAFGNVTGNAKVADIVIDQVINGGILGPIFIPIATIPGGAPTPNTEVPLSILGALVKITLNEQPVPQAPGTIELTAAHIQVIPLGNPTGGLVDLQLGRVQCGRNTVATAEIDFDTSGDLGGDTIQPKTRNAFKMSYTSAVNRPAVTLVGKIPIDGDIVIDPDRPLPAGCNGDSIDGTVTPNVRVIICNVGAVTAGNTVTRVIPVNVNEAATSPIKATMQVFGGSLAEILSNPLTEEETLLVEETEVSGNAGGLAVPSPNRTGLPQDIPGTLHISAPSFVNEAAYGGTPCTVVNNFNPDADTYPAIPGNKIFSCGSSIPGDPGSPNALAFTYAGNAPVTGGGTPALGRVVIIRTATGQAQEIPLNSYYADLRFRVGPGAVTTTSSSSTSTSTTAPSTTSSSSTTSTTAPDGSTTTSTTAASTTTSSSSSTSSTTSTLPPATLPPATLPSTTTTTAASTTSSSSSSSTSTTARVVSASTTKAPLARTGADSTTTAAIALGLLGVGLVITGRGFQAEANGIAARRRRRSR
jgi:hypothetical protein